MGGGRGIVNIRLEVKIWNFFQILCKLINSEVTVKSIIEPDNNFQMIN